MRFADVPGHKNIKSGFLNMLESNRLSHAILLSGEAGRGKLMLARAFAQYLNCDNPSKEDSCGLCPSCVKMSKLIHPDLHFTYPVIAKKSGDKPLSADFIQDWRKYLENHPIPDRIEWLNTLSGESSGNKQGNIAVHECQDIIRKLNLKSFEGKFKVQIIWLPEYLGEAGNILLKLIEEPPEKTLFLLVTNEPERILATIQSRTQEVRVPPLDHQSIKEFITARGHEISPSDLDMAEGNLLNAMKMTESDDIEFEESIRNWMRCCAKNRGDEMVDWAEQYNKWNRETQKQFLVYFLGQIRKALHLQSAFKQNEDPMLKYLSERDFNSLVECKDDVSQALYYLERNAHPRILILNLSIKLGKLFLNKSKFTTS